MRQIEKRLMSFFFFFFYKLYKHRPTIAHFLTTSLYRIMRDNVIENRIPQIVRIISLVLDQCG